LLCELLLLPQINHVKIHLPHSDVIGVSVDVINIVGMERISLSAVLDVLESGRVRQAEDTPAVTVSEICKPGNNTYSGL